MSNGVIVGDQMVNFPWQFVVGTNDLLGVLFIFATCVSMNCFP